MIDGALRIASPEIRFLVVACFVGVVAYNFLEWYASRDMRYGVIVFVMFLVFVAIAAMLLA